MNDPSEMDEIEFKKQLERIDALLDNALKIDRNFKEKYNSIDNYPDEVLISYVHNLERLCGLYSRKGGLYLPSFEAIYDDEMTKEFMSKIDYSLDIEAHGAYVVDIIKEKKIPVMAEDLAGWRIFDPDLLMHPESESYNIINRGESGY